MRNIGWLALGLVACLALVAGHGVAEEATPAEPPAKPPILTLRDAARKGRLAVEGRNPSSYKQVHLHLHNRTDEPLRIDIAGSHLLPKTGGSCQRLGLGPVVTPRGKPRRKPTRRKPRIDDDPPGTVIVQLAPNEEKVVHVNTCCLDSGKPAPRKHTFRAANSKLPAVREKVLRWWADNPHTPQSAVNSAIWQFRDEVVIPKGKDTVPVKSGIAAHAGTVYMLRSGELMARDPDGIERFLGTEIQAVHPTPSAIYAEALGIQTNPVGQRIRELWRLVPTGQEPWRLVAPIPDKLALRTLRVAPSGAILVTTNLGLYRVDPEAKRFTQLVDTGSAENLSVRFLKGSRVQVTLRRPSQKGYYQGGVLKGQGMPVCELWDLDPKTGKRDLVKAFWNVRQIKAGPAGVYALTPAGKLRRLVGRSFKTAPGQHAYERILRVGRTCVWLESKKGRMVAVDKVGRLRFESGPRVDGMTDWDLDAHSDEVVYLRRSRYWRMEPKKGEGREITDPER